MGNELTFQLGQLVSRLGHVMLEFCPADLSSFVAITGYECCQDFFFNINVLVLLLCHYLEEFWKLHFVLTLGHSMDKITITQLHLSSLTCAFSSSPYCTF